MYAVGTTSSFRGVWHDHLVVFTWSFLDVYTQLHRHLNLSSLDLIQHLKSHIWWWGPPRYCFYGWVTIAQTMPYIPFYLTTWMYLIQLSLASCKSFLTCYRSSPSPLLIKWLQNMSLNWKNSCNNNLLLPKLRCDNLLLHK